MSNVRHLHQPGGHFCPNCAHPVSPLAGHCTACGHPLPGGAMKSKATALLLCFFLGHFGAHRFYLGDPGTALLLAALFWFGFFGMLGSAAAGTGFLLPTLMLLVAVIWGLIDFISLACRGDDFYRAKAQK